MMSEIEVQRDLFRRWFKQPLADLYNNPDAGFPVLMITLPLLERYLREKGNNHQEKLQDDFHKELGQMLPSLSDIATSRKFWRFYRHGNCIVALSNSTLMCSRLGSMSVPRHTAS